MGLDTSHDAWHGAYSSFFRFRVEIAEAAGIPLVPDPDRGERLQPATWAVANPNTDYMGNWTEPPDDPILYLIDHSDCDGSIRNEHLAPLIARLIPLQLATMQDRLDQFLIGLRAALHDGDDVGFW